MTVKTDKISGYIKLLSERSDRYGYPYPVGLMDHYGVDSLRNVTADMARKYYIEKMEEIHHVTEEA